jgi:hypothetical protein
LVSDFECVPLADIPVSGEFLGTATGQSGFCKRGGLLSPFGLCGAHGSPTNSRLFEISLVRLSDTYVSSLREAVPREHSSNGREAHLDRSCADLQTSTLPYIRPDFSAAAWSPHSRSVTS